MSDAYLGQIMLVAGTYAPAGWQLCQGQQMSIPQNSALYSLIGNYYGGNGTTFFNLPNLQGIVVSGTSSGAPVGTASGTTTVKLTTEQLAAHYHLLVATGVGGDATTSAGNLLATSAEAPRVGSKTGIVRYATSSPSTTMTPASIAQGGGGGAHNNMQPYLVLNYCICINGIYPPRN